MLQTLVLYIALLLATMDIVLYKGERKILALLVPPLLLVHIIFTLCPQFVCSDEFGIRHVCTKRCVCPSGNNCILLCKLKLV